MRVTSTCCSRSMSLVAMASTWLGVLPAPKMTSGKSLRNARCRSTWAKPKSATGAAWKARTTSSAGILPARNFSRSSLASVAVTARAWRVQIRKFKFQIGFECRSGVGVYDAEVKVWFCLLFVGTLARADLLVSSYRKGRVCRFNEHPGQYVDTFVPNTSGLLTLPHALAFGPDGNLYVASAGNDSVLRYDGTGGGFLNMFVQPGVGGLDYPV